MTYKHYWQQHRDFTMGEWNRVMQRAARSVVSSFLKCVADSGSQEVHIRDLTINKDYISFSGDCDTFRLDRICTPPMANEVCLSGCNTVGHVYDPVVVDVLRVAYLCSGGEAITPSSDGDEFDDVLNTLQEIN